MARYLDGTEELPAEAPKHCPFCCGKIVTKWTSATQWRTRRGSYTIAVPVHVCEKCGIAVRIHGIPRRGLYKTRQAARKGGAAAAAAANARREAYAHRR